MCLLLCTELGAGRVGSGSDRGRIGVGSGSDRGRIGVGSGSDRGRIGGRIGVGPGPGMGTDLASAGGPLRQLGLCVLYFSNLRIIRTSADVGIVRWVKPVAGQE